MTCTKVKRWVRSDVFDVYVVLSVQAWDRGTVLAASMASSHFVRADKDSNTRIQTSAPPALPDPVASTFRMQLGERGLSLPGYNWLLLARQYSGGHHGAGTLPSVSQARFPVLSVQFPGVTPDPINGCLEGGCDG